MQRCTVPAGESKKNDLQKYYREEIGGYKFITTSVRTRIKGL
jgi:hypothetical protein